MIGKHCPTCTCVIPGSDEAVLRAMTEFHEVCPGCGTVKAKRLKVCEQCSANESNQLQKEHSMMKRLTPVAMLVGLVLFPVLVEAFTCPNTTTCTVAVTYGEPKVNANGTPIDDLKETVVTLSVNGVAATPMVTPATAATGGGMITKSATVAAPSCKSSKVDGAATAIDTVGNVGTSANTSLTLDRTKDVGCEPGPVTPFTLN